LLTASYRKNDNLGIVFAVSTAELVIKGQEQLRYDKITCKTIILVAKRVNRLISLSSQSAYKMKFQVSSPFQAASYAIGIQQWTIRAIEEKPSQNLHLCMATASRVTRQKICI